MVIASLGTQRGSVSEFDEFRGLGTIAGDDGVSYRFHCTGIADGSRTIDVGADVGFAVIAGRLGHWEAWGIEVR
ncbi:MAG: cold shock domain-containing protein [Acidimicrobiales bacterium]|nr:cold shock domain-containing protein [Acidimicrobiales bacterium]